MHRKLSADTLRMQEKPRIEILSLDMLINEPPQAETKKVGCVRPLMTFVSLNSMFYNFSVLNSSKHVIHTAHKC